MPAGYQGKPKATTTRIAWVGHSLDHEESTSLGDNDDLRQAIHPRLCRVLQQAEPPRSVVPVGHAALPQRRPSCRKTQLRSRSGWRPHEADVLAPAELAKRHRALRWRVVMGPGYRADLWAALEAEPDMSAAELARRTSGSFATAWSPPAAIPRWGCSVTSTG